MNKNFELVQKFRVWVNLAKAERLLVVYGNLDSAFIQGDIYICISVARRVKKLDRGRGTGMGEKKEVREGMLGFVGQTLASSKMNFAASCAG